MCKWFLKYKLPKFIQEEIHSLDSFVSIKEIGSYKPYKNNKNILVSLVNSFKVKDNNNNTLSIFFFLS